MSQPNVTEVDEEVVGDLTVMVMLQHGWGEVSSKTEQAVGVVNRKAVIDATLVTADPDMQVEIAMSVIEDQLITTTVLTEPKQYPAPDLNGPVYEVVVGNVGRVPRRRERRTVTRQNA